MSANPTPPASNSAVDPVELARALIRCPSVTPAEGGALALLEARLAALGFACHRLKFSAPGTPDVENLYARLGSGKPNFCFAGHTDVVPVGDTKGWTRDPFGADIVDGMLYGRGAADMKGAVAAFVAAASRFIAARGPSFGGSISLLITGDEEGPSINGTRKVLEWLKARGETLEACLVGEPTNPTQLGEAVKIGRRGNFYATLTALGTQGHTAYPHFADNAAHRIVRMLAAMLAEPLDQGSEHFEPSTLQVATIDVGNSAGNIVPGRASARLNIRFNDRHTPQSLEAWLRRHCDAVGGKYELAVELSGPVFLTPPGKLSALIASAVERHTGLKPTLGTAGGTSDARFIKDYCPVAEFGLVGQTMHKVDERVPVADLERLAAIYRTVLEGFFAGS
ncbi:MAG TPA: succinyl-diaminopimelate desuccinylase [Alphaproteobacteria bacterium]|nr:succinyl-diaminopimelate desuccinylase [Alphaproteobacteria bacterium]